MKAGLFTYAWDLEAEGYDTAIGEMAANGITHINLATAYHAGKFLLPRNPRHRTYFPEDGSVYFRPDLSRYGRIKPRVNSLVSHTSDPVSRLVEASSRYGVGYAAWIVLMHNSWLGARHPDVTVHTAFGDPVIHSLCPAHPDVREYVVALISDLVSRHEVGAVVLEAPGYMTYTHGWHHEFGGVALDRVQERLFGISFNPHELRSARDAGIDAEGVRDAVAALLDRSWNEGLALAQGDDTHPDAEAVLASPEVGAYLRWQDEQVVSLAQAIREAVRDASPETEIRHFATLDGRQASDALIETGDTILLGYASSDEDAIARGQTGRKQGKKAFGMVRAMPPDATEPGQVARRIEAWRSAGVDGIDTYNYGFLTRQRLREFYDALR
jgi:hypothetical protein